jgi:hypothetical protein
MRDRRTLLCAGSAWLLLRYVPASAEKLSVSDPDAFEAGFVLDGSKVDTQRFPPNSAGHSCQECRSFKGSAHDDWSMCGVYGKEVPAKGWCSAFRSRAS